MLFFSQSVTVSAITEAEVAAVGKEIAAGNILIWFLCAVAFLKISQKIDSFMSSLGISIGRTGGSMIAELLIAARGFTMVKSITGGSFRMGGGTDRMNSSSFLSGGLAGIVGRQFAQSAVKTMTGHSRNPISRRAFE